MFSGWLNKIDFECPSRKTALIYPLSLLLIGTLAFFYNLDIALFGGSEGLYAHISREMTLSGQYFQLTYQDAPYVNKPPLFFWMLAVSTRVFGENETALRLPGALFSLATMMLTYFLGKSLFSRTAGLWAALVVGISFSGMAGGCSSIRCRPSLSASHCLPGSKPISRQPGRGGI